MLNRIYYDYAATTPLDKRVLWAMKPYLTDLYANPSSLHQSGRRALRALDGARDEVAKALNASPAEIYFTASGSEADCWAVKGFARALGRDCKQILVSAVEHHAVINAALSLQKEGYDVRFLPVDGEGTVDGNALEESLKTPTSLVCVMTANNEVGTVQPVREIADAAHAAGAVFFTDAVHAALYCDLDVQKSGADMLSLSAHKFYGPKGMGALFVKKGVPMSALIDGGLQERGLRGGTSNVAGAAGLAEALRLAVEEREKNVETVKLYRDTFIEGVFARIEGVKLNGSRERRTPCNANLSFPGVNGALLLQRLDLKGISASAGSACMAGDLSPSHVLQAMRLPEERAESAVRFTFGRENTLKQLDYALGTLAKIVDDLQKRT